MQVDHAVERYRYGRYIELREEPPRRERAYCANDKQAFAERQPPCEMSAVAMYLEQVVDKSDHRAHKERKDRQPGLAAREELELDQGRTAREVCKCPHAGDRQKHAAPYNNTTHARRADLFVLVKRVEDRRITAAIALLPRLFLPALVRVQVMRYDRRNSHAYKKGDRRGADELNDVGGHMGLVPVV